MAEQETGTRMAKCLKCGKEIQFELPVADVVNKPSYSIVVIPHNELPQCAHCGQAYAFKLIRLKGMEYGWHPVEIQREESGIIIPPPGLTV